MPSPSDGRPRDSTSEQALAQAKTKATEHVRSIRPFHLRRDAPLQMEERDLEMAEDLLSQAPLQRPSSA